MNTSAITDTLSSSSVNSSPPTVEGDLSMPARLSELAGRVLLAVLFLISGLGKIGSYAMTAGYMASVGLPGLLLPLVIATEVVGAIAIILGWKTRIVAFLLAGYTLLTAFLFHNNFADQTQAIMFLKNVSIAGAFLLLVGRGAGMLSLDRRFAKS